MGTGQRAQSARNLTPGPGQYQLSQGLGKGPKYSMALKTDYFDPTKSIASPGPGNYNPNYRPFFKNLSYTMSSKTFKSKTELSPGPGNYELRSDKNLQVPSYKFGKEEKCQLLNTTAKHTPGPGNYETRTNLGDGAPRIMFGKESRGDRGRPMTPGPGTYQHKNLLGNDGPRIHISSVKPDVMTPKEARLVPGPGQYTLNMSNRPKTPSYRIGSSKRDGFFKYLENNPGPGQYNANSSQSLSKRPKSPAWSVGTSQRPPLSTCELVPGPGNYTISSSVGGPKVN
jgi:hypothetical protein